MKEEVVQEEELEHQRDLIQTEQFKLLVEQVFLIVLLVVPLHMELDVLHQRIHLLMLTPILLVGVAETLQEVL